MVVQPVVFHQLFVGAHFGDPAAFQDDDQIGAAHRGQAVGDNDRRSPDHQSFQCLLDQQLGFGVDRRCGLVQDQDWRVLEDRPGDRQPLFLPARQFDPSFANDCIIAVRQPGDKIVGVTDYCDYPLEALEKERIGGYWSPDIEKIVALQPDLLISSYGYLHEAITTLEGLGFTVFDTKAIDLDDLLDDIRTVGQITDSEIEADTLTAEMQTRIDAVTDETEGLPPEEKPRTFHILYYPPIYTSGQGTFVHDLIEKAGGVNVFADLTGWPTVDVEALIGRDPEVIIVTAMGGTAGGTWEWVNTEPLLADVSARKNGRLYYVESNWVERYGPRIVLGLEQVAKSIHPEIFFDPWDYDEDINGDIGKTEAIKAIQDYFNGLMAKAQAIEVVMLYFG